MTKQKKQQTLNYYVVAKRQDLINGEGLEMIPVWRAGSYQSSDLLMGAFKKSEELNARNLSFTFVRPRIEVKIGHEESVDYKGWSAAENAWGEGDRQEPKPKGREFTTYEMTGVTFALDADSEMTPDYFNVVRELISYAEKVTEWASGLEREDLYFVLQSGTDVLYVEPDEREKFTAAAVATAEQYRNTREAEEYAALTDDEMMALHFVKRHPELEYPKSDRALKNEAKRAAYAARKAELVDAEPQVGDEVRVDLKSWKGIIGELIAVSGTKATIRYFRTVDQAWEYTEPDIEIREANEDFNGKWVDRPNFKEENTRLKNVVVIERPGWFDGYENPSTFAD